MDGKNNIRAKAERKPELKPGTKNEVTKLKLRNEKRNKNRNENRKLWLRPRCSRVKKAFIYLLYFFI
jgi:hypothetical protein